MDNTPLYIAREFLKKRRLMDMNSDQKWTKNYISKPRTRVSIDRAVDWLLTAVDRAVDRWKNTQRANSLLDSGISVGRLSGRPTPSASPASSRRSTNGHRPQLICALFVHSWLIGLLSSAVSGLLSYYVELRFLYYLLQWVKKLY